MRSHHISACISNSSKNNFHGEERFRLDFSIERKTRVMFESYDNLLETSWNLRVFHYNTLQCTTIDYRTDRSIINSTTKNKPYKCQYKRSYSGCNFITITNPAA